MHQAFLLLAYTLICWRYGERFLLGALNRLERVVSALSPRVALRCQAASKAAMISSRSAVLMT
jgi:hypothetical protein